LRHSVRAAVLMQLHACAMAPAGPGMHQAGARLSAWKS